MSCDKEAANGIRLVNIFLSFLSDNCVKLYKKCVFENWMGNYFKCLSKVVKNKFNIVLVYSRLTLF